MIAICGAGGGSRGIFQGGCLKAVEELVINAGLPVSVVTSSSVGTLNLLKFSQDGYKSVEELWLRVKTKSIYKKPWSKTVRFLTRSSMYDSSPLAKMIREEIHWDKLQNLPYSFIIHTTSFTPEASGEYSISIGAMEGPEDLHKFALASASPPAFFPLVKHGGLDLGDSGVTNNYAISTALDMGCDTIILMLPAMVGTPAPIKGGFDVLKSVMDLSMRSQYKLQIKSVNKINKIIDEINVNLEPDYKKIKLIVIEPDKEFSFDFLDFDFKGEDRKELLNYGYNIAKKVLQKELLSEGKYSN